MGRGIQTITKGADCLNHTKAKTSIFTGTRDAIAKQQQLIISYAELNVYKISALGSNSLI